MTMATEETIHPCPFSKGYGIPRSQAWLLLTVFCLYRLIISSLFVVLFFTRIGPSLLGSYDSQLYAYASLSYLALALISVITTYLRKPDYTIQTQIFMFTDIVLVPLVMHACGGITSGIGILLAVTTAAGGLLIGGRCAMLFAAMASLSILTEQIYASQTDAFENTAYTYAGMLGASFFTIALLSYVLARRTEQTESMLSQREETIFRLEELNKYIIRQLNSGIIISNQKRAVSLMNDAALRLLNRQSAPKSLDEISSELSASFENWRINPDRDIAKL
ncbi:MAG: two-component sensor histidine kinase, partial [Gammaproteobacteria bacterium]